ncbi:hypothetical protein RCO48_12070 [Peribacillus frigoritolerans]|nr:hypothetical protein [Peribacillus frigoritolerans]
MEKARLCFITGGVRSGKSSFAERKSPGVCTPEGWELALPRLWPSQ